MTALDDTVTIQDENHTGEDAEDENETGEAGVGRAAALGAVIGFLVITVAITVGGTLGGIGAGASLAIGAFVGMWGGAGFGFMVGGTVPLSRHLDAEAHRREHHAEP